MRKQCIMFMFLLAASTAVTQELYLDEKTMPHFYVHISFFFNVILWKTCKIASAKCFYPR